MKKYRLIVKMAGVLFLAGLPARGQKILEVPGQQEKAKAWGRGVIGKVVLPAAAQGKVQWSTGAAKLQKNVPPPPLPGNWKSMNNSQRRAWFMQWLKTPAGQAYKREARPYTTNFANDGALRFEGVRTGTYRLLVKVVNASGETLGTSQRIVNVPKGLGGPKAPPIDMGTIVLKIQKGLKVGDPAPDFQVKSLDGSPIRLADYKGKVVLLDFWATWCGPCRRETPISRPSMTPSGRTRAS